MNGISTFWERIWRPHEPPLEVEQFRQRMNQLRSASANAPPLEEDWALLDPYFPDSPPDWPACANEQ